MTTIDMIFGILLACVTLSSVCCGWTAGRHWERRIWQSRLNIMCQILRSREARARTEVEELRQHLPVVKVGADFNIAGTLTSRMRGSRGA